MSRQTEYKETRLPWCSQIPYNWEVKQLKYCFQFTTGFTPPTKDENLFNGDNIWVTIGDMSERYISDSKTRITDEAIEKYNGILVKSGSLLFSFKLSVGKVAFATKDIYTNEAIIAIPPVENLNLNFFYYTLPFQLLQNANENIYGAKILNQDLIKNAYLVIPPLKQQNIISKFLDEQTAEIDNLISKKQKLIDCLKEERLVQIRLLTTKGIGKKQFKNSGIDWIGEIPKEWEAKKLKYVSRKVQTGNTPPTSKYEYYGDEFNWYTPADFSDNLLLENSSRKISFLAVQDEIVRVFPENSVLIVGIGATLGKVGYITSPASSNQQINAIVFSSIEEAKFYANLFYAFKDVVLSKSNASTLAILNQAQTKDFIVPVPAEQELPLIVNEIEELNTRIENTIRKIEQEIELIKEYRTSLINEVVTGKITLN